MNAAAPGDDIDLVARAREGDHAAFGELVCRHQAAVHRAALAATGSPEDADDVAQEAFLLAFRRLKGFRGEAAFKTWMLSITWNQAMTHRRRAGRWWKRFVAVESDGGAAFESMRVAVSEATPEDLAAHGQLRDAIAGAIRGLPEKLRDPLLLASSGEYSYEEIGAMVKAPVGTIKWRVSEARRLIKVQLAAQGHR